MAMVVIVLVVVLVTLTVGVQRQASRLLDLVIVEAFIVNVATAGRKSVALGGAPPRQACGLEEGRKV